MSGALPAFYELTPDDRGAIVIVVGYAFVSTTVLLTLIRFASVFILRREWAWDDLCIVTGTILALVQTVLSQRAVDSGLGRHLDTLDPGSVASYFKFTYANQILAITVIAVAQVSVVLLITRLSPDRTLHLICRITTAAIAIWVLFSILALSLQCRLPEPWVYTTDRCVGRGALWYPILLLNIVIDLVTAAIFIPSLLKLQMPRARQLAVCCLFGSRVIVCGVGIAHMVVLPRALTAADQTWATLEPAILIQINMDLSVMTAVLPSLCRFFSELQMGRGTRLAEAHHYDNGSEQYKLSNLPRKKEPFVGRNIATLTSRISAGARAKEGSGHTRHISRRENAENRGRLNISQQRPPSQGVLQTWEISYEVEREDDDDAAGRSNDSRTALTYA